jgi:hypothetical protein
MNFGYSYGPGFGAAFGGSDPFGRMPGGQIGGPPMGGPLFPGRVGGPSVGGPPSVAPPGRGGFGAALAGGAKRAAGGFGDWLMRDDNLLGLAQVGTGVYGAFKQGQAMDRQNEQDQEQRQYERDQREEEKQRRASGDPLRAMLLARLMASRGGQ